MIYRRTYLVLDKKRITIRLKARLNIRVCIFVLAMRFSGLWGDLCHSQ